jgi:hypothetical protein
MFTNPADGVVIIRTTVRTATCRVLAQQFKITPDRPDRLVNGNYLYCRFDRRNAIVTMSATGFSRCMDLLNSAKDVGHR